MLPNFRMLMFRHSPSDQKALPGRNQDLHCDVISFNTAISGMKSWSMASKMLSQLAVWSVQGDLSSFTSVIATQRWPQALNCLKLMRDLGCPGADFRKNRGDFEDLQPLQPQDDIEETQVSLLLCINSHQ